jgi:hypothetical protein
MTQFAAQPEVKELFSGKPVEWSPHDVDARYLRWDSLSFNFVEKGRDAAPTLRERSFEPLTAVDREMLWRLCEASPEITIGYGRVDIRDSSVAFEFPPSFRSRTDKEGAPPVFLETLRVSSFWHTLNFQLLQSKTGRWDLLVSFSRNREDNDTRQEDPGPELDISDSGLAIYSLNRDFGNRIPRSLVGIPSLLVFQDMQIGERFKLIVDRPVAPERLLSGIIVFTGPQPY